MALDILGTGTEHGFDSQSLAFLYPISWNHRSSGNGYDFRYGHGLGRRAMAGFVATFGMMAGGICHTLFGTAIVFGLAHLSRQVIVPMLILGSCYMIWIGITLMRRPIKIGVIEGEVTKNHQAIFLQALVTCLLNPKAWFFIMAVYPQFMKPSLGPIALQAVIMGSMTIFLQFAIYGGVAYTAASVRHVLIAKPDLALWTERASGLLLIGMGGVTLIRDIVVG